MFLFRNEFAPYVELNKHVRQELLEQYMTSATAIDLREVFDKEFYDNLMQVYQLSKDASITANIATIDSTALIGEVNYCYVQTSAFVGRVRYNVMSATEIELLQPVPDATTAKISLFIDFDLFEKIRPFYVLSVWLRYAQASKIQSTASGLVAKELDFSQFVSEDDMGRYLNMLARDKNFYKKELIEFLQPSQAKNYERVRNRIAYPVKKPSYKI